jgi:hypothetical protein
MTAFPGPALAFAPPVREHLATERPAARTRRGLAATPAAAVVPAARAGGERTAGVQRSVDEARPAVDEGPAGHPQAAEPEVSAACAMAAELVRRAEEDRQATREAGTAPTPERRRRVAECRRDNAAALEAIVRRHGWPAADLVGPTASTAALMILLHAPDLDFRLRCRDLIEQATADGRTPAVHFAYIADHCAVDLGEPQFYGTRVNPVTLRPYPVRRPDTVDERREDVGLGPLEEQMRALRLGG